MSSLILRLFSGRGVDRWYRSHGGAWVCNEHRCGRPCRRGCIWERAWSRPC